MDLTEKQIQENFKMFMDLLEPAVTRRKGANWEGLKDKLVNSDFAIAPASTKYHSSYAGGLVVHSLNVYNNLKKLIEIKKLTSEISEDSITIVALLHDFSKMNYYERSMRNKKVYSDYGSKRDDMGKFDWVSEPSFSVRPVEERFVYGNHEETAEFMVRKFVPLTVDESSAILVHHGGMGYDSVKEGANTILNRYKLAISLHLADMLATYLDEGDNY